MMRSCGEAGREREVHRVNKNLTHCVLEREASDQKIDARGVRRKTGRMNRLRWVVGDKSRNFKPDGRRVKARVSFGEPTVVVVDPNADGSKRPSALDNQVKVIPDAVDVAGNDQQPAFCGGDLARTCGASRGGCRRAFGIGLYLVPLLEAPRVLARLRPQKADCWSLLATWMAPGMTSI